MHMYACLAFYEYKMARELNNQGDAKMKKQICFFFVSAVLVMYAMPGVAEAGPCTDAADKNDCCIQYSNGIYASCVSNPPDFYWMCYESYYLPCEAGWYPLCTENCWYVYDFYLHSVCMDACYVTHSVSCQIYIEPCVSTFLGAYNTLCLSNKNSDYNYCMIE